ncbi:MAG: hypothetical protein Q8Q95_03400 [bacterium]|nr:hypothetical protein [bacterium]
MNKNIILARFIEKNGLKIVFILTSLIALLVGLVFYFYAWQTMTIASDATSAATGLRQALLETVVKDLDIRAEKLDGLNRNQLNIRNIFR